MSQTTPTHDERPEEESDAAAIPSDPPEQVGPYERTHNVSNSPDTRTVAWRQEMPCEDHYVRVQRRADGTADATAYYAGHDTGHADLTDGEATAREAYEAALTFMRETAE